MSTLDIQRSSSGCHFCHPPKGEKVAVHELKVALYEVVSWRALEKISGTTVILKLLKAILPYRG